MKAFWVCTKLASWSHKYARNVFALFRDSQSPFVAGVDMNEKWKCKMLTMKFQVVADKITGGRIRTTTVK